MNLYRMCPTGEEPPPPGGGGKSIVPKWWKRIWKKRK
jgi:hypothetical protein